VALVLVGVLLVVVPVAEVVALKVVVELWVDEVVDCLLLTDAK
jgi:hypothetical protein